MHKILIANRGEIAVRVARACRDLGLASVAVYSDADRASRHVRVADEACWIGASPAAESYLRIDRLIDAAQTAGADAVHPGYGFLSENAVFAAACRDASLVFIGPTPEAIALMGNKTEARRLAMSAGVPVVPGTDGPLAADLGFTALIDVAASIGYPLMVKAVAGGGGKGMRVVRDAATLVDAVRGAKAEAASAFGDGSVYLERRLERPRHIEVQLLADTHGTVLPFVERECSIQRRQQKVLEETPSPAVTPALRARLAAAATAIARAAGYSNAGTIEFLLDADGAFYFLEMNTRLQVEHPISEAVTGVDLVAWQIRLAAGERLTIDPDQVLHPRGHAIECRVYAEDADAGFIPSPGRIAWLTTPGGPGVRDDGGVETGGDVPVFYDPLLSKLIAWGDDRRQAIARMDRALAEYRVLGVRTSVPFFRWLLRQEAFLQSRVHTSYLDEVLQQRAGEPFVPASVSQEEVAAIAAVIAMQSAFAPPALRRDRSAFAPPALRRDGSAFAPPALRRDGSAFAPPALRRDEAAGAASAAQRDSIADLSRRSGAAANADLSRRSTEAPDADLSRRSAAAANADLSRRSAAGANADLSRRSAAGANADLSRRSAAGAKAEGWKKQARHEALRH